MNIEKEYKVGEQLNNAESQKLIQDNVWTEIISTATHPEPGGFFGNGYTLESLKCEWTGNNAGRLYSCTSDIDSDEDSDPVYFWGQFDDIESFVNRVADFIVSGDYEVNAAVSFHFDEDVFAHWDDSGVDALSQIYYFICSYVENNFYELLEIRLREISPIYRYLVRFINKPDDSEFSETAERLKGAYSFTDDYARIKYSGG